MHAVFASQNWDISAVKREVLNYSEFRILRKSSLASLISL